MLYEIGDALCWIGLICVIVLAILTVLWVFALDREALKRFWPKDR